MKVWAESTDKIVTLIGSGKSEIPARVWEATTDTGVRCLLFVTRVVVARDQDQSQFERELQETRAPSAEAASFPLRLIL